jgi:hypothetical protein
MRRHERTCPTCHNQRKPRWPLFFFAHLILRAARFRRGGLGRWYLFRLRMDDSLVRA